SHQPAGFRAQHGALPGTPAHDAVERAARVPLQHHDRRFANLAGGVDLGDRQAERPGVDHHGRFAGCDAGLVRREDAQQRRPACGALEAPDAGAAPAAADPLRRADWPLADRVESRDHPLHLRHSRLAPLPRLIPGALPRRLRATGSANSTERRSLVTAIDPGTTRNRYRSSQSRSALLHERAARVLPGGNTRTTVHLDPYPPYAMAGRGAIVIDAEGEERIDFLNNYTSLMHGHADPDINDAVIEQLSSGTAFSMPTESEVRLAEIIVERIPSVEQVRFTNSGTEAVMMAIHAARAYTGRPAIVKFEGSYHGSYDHAAVSTTMPRDAWGAEAPPSVPYAAGTPQGVLDDVVVLRYNDVELAERVIEREAGRLAAILVDPIPWRMGLIAGTREFLGRLRGLADAHGIVL